MAAPQRGQPDRRLSRHQARIAGFARKRGPQRPRLVEAHKAAAQFYAEQLSGSPFTAPQASNQRSWLYRIRPTVKHSGRYKKIDHGRIRTAPSAREEGDLPIGQLRWGPIPIPDEALTFVNGLRTMTTAGDAETRIGMAAHVLLVTASMQNEYFFNADGELLIVAQENGLRFRTEFELDANWKISCENFLECYHCAVAHPGFSAAVDISPDAYRLSAEGLVSSQVGPLRQNGNSFLADGEVPRSQFHFLWPNFGLNVFPGHPNLSCGPMLPLGPERTGRFLDYFFAPEVDQEWIDELVAFDNQVGTEDRALVEGVQRGVRSGILTEGRILSESEQLVAHFQRLCAEALAG